MRKQGSKVITLICFVSLKDLGRNSMKKLIHKKEMLKQDGHSHKRKEMARLDQWFRAATKICILRELQLLQNN